MSFDVMEISKVSKSLTALGRKMSGRLHCLMNSNTLGPKP